MYRKWIPAFALASCMLLALPQVVQAEFGMMSDWQAHYSPCTTLVDASCTACHTAVPALNVYGDDIKTGLDLSLNFIDAVVAAESEDADGDGYTNGQEIVVDCTLPWDDTSHGTVATTASTWGQIKVLFR